MLIKTVPNKEKSKAILKMVETTLQMIREIDDQRFPSNIVKDYYEIIRELISVVLLLDGYKTLGEGAHKELIEYLSKNYDDFSQKEIIIIDELRRLRNRIAYDGFFIDPEYIKTNKKLFITIINKLKKQAGDKL